MSKSWSPIMTKPLAHLRMPPPKSKILTSRRLSIKPFQFCVNTKTTFTKLPARWERLDRDFQPSFPSHRRGRLCCLPAKGDDRKLERRILLTERFADFQP